MVETYVPRDKADQKELRNFHVPRGKAAQRNMGISCSSSVNVDKVVHGNVQIFAQ